MDIISKLFSVRPLKQYSKGEKMLNDSHNKEVEMLVRRERKKEPSRTEVINYLLSLSRGDTNYLEIGVRNPDHNFNHIEATNKYSVDPGVEFEQNPVDFKMTSDEFFDDFSKGEILSKDVLFDVIFIDGLHLAEQVDRDIANALKYTHDDGFIVLHDCNPPSEWHARESFRYSHTPAGVGWNGTTWKAFTKWRSDPAVYSCCIDTDWGVGVISKKRKIGTPTALSNPFFEYQEFDRNRSAYLNLIEFKVFKEMIQL